MRTLLVSAAVLTVLGTKAAIPACLEMPESVTLKFELCRFKGPPTL